MSNDASTAAGRKSPAGPLRYPVAVLAVGAAAGLGGALLSILLHSIEQAVYGYRDSAFLEGVMHASPGVRVGALAGAGLLGGVGWWALRRWAAPSVSVEEAVGGRRLPILTTVADATLQIGVVGLGASVGRELAPRLLGALAADRLAGVIGLDRRRRAVLIAAGAGAGLTAIYNVPLGGTFFTVEVLLADLRIGTVVAAGAASVTATLVARFAVPDVPTYAVHPGAATPSLIGWAVVAGPVIGLVALGFRLLTGRLRRRRPTGWRLVVALPVVCLLVGMVGAELPQVLGNGRALAQIALSGSAAWGLLLLLGAAKFATTSATIGAGANGGTLTPSVSMGAAFGAASATGWALLWPGIDPRAAAICGAAAFLAGTTRAPLTAVALGLEFTAAPVGLLLPLLLAVTSATAVGLVFARGTADRGERQEPNRTADTKPTR